MNKGFTLIELLIVVAIIGILAAIGATVIPGLLTKTKITAVKEQHANIVNFIRLQKAKCDPGSKTLQLVTASGPGHDYEPPCSDFLKPSHITTSATMMFSHLIGIGFKNPVEPTYPFHEYSGGTCSSGGQYGVGCTKISGQNGIMTISTISFDGNLTNTIDFN